MELLEGRKYILLKGTEQEEIVTYIRPLWHGMCRVVNANFERFIVKEDMLSEMEPVKKKTLFGKFLDKFAEIAPAIIVGLITKKFSRK